MKQGSNGRPVAAIYGPNDIPLYRFYQIDLRSGAERRQESLAFDGPERRSGKDRRQDADWRFSLIRRRSMPNRLTRYAVPLAFKRAS